MSIRLVVDCGSWLRIPLIADTHSTLIADSDPDDRGQGEPGAGVTAVMVEQVSAISMERGGAGYPRGALAPGG